tara:strand:- start:1263 stop:1613 length:351 start_codon:yes stop_codon:yes gene_type:complete
MTYRFLVTQPDLNSHGTLHGGILMKWVDEACGMEARLAANNVCATRHIHTVDFVSTARLGDIVEVVVRPSAVGKTSLTFSATVRIARAQIIAHFERIVFVAVDTSHNPVEFGNESG